jgi:AcrR family transcriptional regulator
MPAKVDHKQRRAEIVEAALQCLADGGPSALTIRRIAAELGGSVTTVTHYYTSRDKILADLMVRVASEWHSELEDIKRGAGDPATRLWQTLEWLLPTEEVGQREERMRFAVLAAHQTELFEPLRTRFNAEIEDHLAECLKPFLEPAQIEDAVQVLRVFVAGVVLSYVEYPELWPPDRQVAMLKQALRLMGLPAPAG